MGSVGVGAGGATSGWLVWIADQSEAGFAEAQLAAYGIRRFGSAGCCENMTFTQ